MSNSVRVPLSLKQSDLDDYKKASQFVSKYMMEAREKAKLDSCFCCGKNCTSFCNSHSVPRFALKNIKNGNLIQGALGDDTALPSKKGINNSGTFKLICDECDNSLFRDYEDYKAYENRDNVTQKVMAEIIEKVALNMIYKRHVERQIYLGMKDISFVAFITMGLSQLQNIELDLKDFNNDYLRAKKSIDSNIEGRYVLQFYKKLNYITPIAFQDGLVLNYDLEGKIINDTYNKKANYKVQSLYLCVFPLKNETVILMITDIKDTRYNRFFKQFNKLDENEQLQIINYLIFAYSENVFMSDKIPKEIRNNPELLSVGQLGNMYMSVIGEKPTALVKEDFSYKNIDKIPNFLDEEMAKYVD